MDSKPNVKKTLRLVWLSLHPYRFQLTIGTLIMVLSIGLCFVPPLLIKTIIDTAIPHHDFKMVILLGIGLIAFPTGSALLSWSQNYLNALISQGLIADFRRRLYLHLQSLDLNFFIKTQSGAIITRFLNDVDGLQNIVNQSFLGTFANLITIIGAFIIMFSINWRLALVSAIALPAFALPVFYFDELRYKSSDRTQAALGELSTVLEETLSLSGAVVVKSFGTETKEAKRFQKINDHVKKTQIEQTLVGQWLSVFIQIFTALGPALLYIYGAYLVIDHQIALGTIIAFASYLSQLYNPAISLVNANSNFLGGLALFDRIFNYLNISVTVPEPQKPVPLSSHPCQGISFEHVNFYYPSEDNPPQVLHDISFTAPLGKMTALVGPSGTGKSTILSFAARFYDPTSGTIKLDNIPLTDISNYDLRYQVSVVTQELFLFHTTLRENICYGRENATDEDIHEVIKITQLQDLIDKLPEGLDTLVGERGYRLSGGEKQRVAIARALLCRAPFLLLDEATSSLDSQVEHKIQLALEKLVKDRTVIVIAHRLSTIQHADNILVIDQGKIVEQGTHEQLLKKSGLYQKLYRAQFI